MAKSEYKMAQKLDRINRVYEVYRMICDRGDCLSIRDLAIDGEDILALGARGREVGEMLEMCLHAVLDRPDLNEQNTLKMLVKKELHL
jgi:tRNA nucleotidyltransferase (CCA-adding enzyme)